MSNDIELKYTRCSSTTVRVSVFVGPKLFRCYSVNPGREQTIERMLDGLEETGLKIDRPQMFTVVLENALKQVEPPADGEASHEEKNPLDDMPAEVKAEAGELLKDPGLLLKVIEDVHSLGIAGEENLIVMFYLIGTSRLLPQPLAAVTQGASSAGKSIVQEKTSVLFPEESKFVVSTSSAKSFYYLPPGSLSHRWVIQGEQARVMSEEGEDVKRCLREMLSAGRISRAVTIADKGQIKTKVFVQAGPVAYSDTTTLTNLFVEDLNRVIRLHPDESERQTDLVLQRLAMAAVAPTRPIDDNWPQVQRHHALQRMLRPLMVAVPYAQFLAQRLSTSNLEMRRAFPLLLGGIQASALLHQMQRQLDDAGRLLADATDYENVLELMSGWMVESLATGLSATNVDFYNWLKANFTTEEITVASCNAKGKSTGQAQYQLQKLASQGLLREVAKGHRGRGAAMVYHLNQHEVGRQSVGLPEAAEVERFLARPH